MFTLALSLPREYAFRRLCSQMATSTSLCYVEPLYFWLTWDLSHWTALRLRFEQIRAAAEIAIDTSKPQRTPPATNEPCL